MKELGGCSRTVKVQTRQEGSVSWKRRGWPSPEHSQTWGVLRWWKRPWSHSASGSGLNMVVLPASLCDDGWGKARPLREQALGAQGNEVAACGQSPAWGGGDLRWPVCPLPSQSQPWWRWPLHSPVPWGTAPLLRARTLCCDAQYRGPQCLESLGCSMVRPPVPAHRAFGLAWIPA